MTQSCLNLPRRGGHINSLSWTLSCTRWNSFKALRSLLSWRRHHPADTTVFFHLMKEVAANEFCCFFRLVHNCVGCLWFWVGEVSYVVRLCNASRSLTCWELFNRSSLTALFSALGEVQTRSEFTFPLQISPCVCRQNWAPVTGTHPIVSRAPSLEALNEGLPWLRKHVHGKTQRCLILFKVLARSARWTYFAFREFKRHHMHDLSSPYNSHIRSMTTLTMASNTGIEDLA